MRASIMKREDELMLAHCAGDASAFNELAGLVLQPLHRFFMARTGDWHLSDDLTSETLLRIAGRPHYESREKFPSWLYLIATRILIDHKRKKRFGTSSIERDDEVSDGTKWVADDGPSPDEIAAEHEEEAIQLERLSRIPTDQANALWRFCCGESMPEIAKDTGVPLPTAKSKARLAREKLQEMCGAA